LNSTEESRAHFFARKYTHHKGIETETHSANANRFRERIETKAGDTENFDGTPFRKETDTQMIGRSRHERVK
jgi:hypothetical protein